MREDLERRALAWIAHDPDPTTRDELRALVERARGADANQATADLAERFAGPLEFGTAGLRGLIGAGESRINRAVVRSTTYGLGRYLLSVDEGAARSRGVVVGYDARRLGRELAEDTACTLAALGIPVTLTSGQCSTPIVAFAVKALHAAAGVMVTASHNPPPYNGYKVYWRNGAQIIPPHDVGIAAEIAKAPEADTIARPSLAACEADGRVRRFGEELTRRYLDAVRGLSLRADGDRSIGIVYTPLHGTGDRITRAALAEAGFTDVTSVPEQAEPDGSFPTVAFPNPEEKGALDLATALARARRAPLVLANDPDVDRLAIAVRDARGEYAQLSGNQVGALLGHYVLTAGRAEGPGERLVLASLVSSPMLGVIAASLGARYEETLTGFKWIANRAMEIEQETGARFVFGFEEALGYTVGTVVRDKDGISAAVLAAELAAVLHAEGKTLLDRLDDLARTYGLFVSGQRSVTMPGTGGLARIAEMMARLRASPPTRIGTADVLAVRDYQQRTRTAADGAVTALALPVSNVLAYELGGGSRVIARPSGTEPKIKFYIDVREPIAAGEAVAKAKQRADATMAALTEAFVALAT
jgi:phosphomannomutase